MVELIHHSTHSHHILSVKGLVQFGPITIPIVRAGKGIVVDFSSLCLNQIRQLAPNIAEQRSSRP